MLISHRLKTGSWEELGANQNKRLEFKKKKQAVKGTWIKKRA